MTRRTFIIDNGGEYSGHELLFVETGAEPADVEALVAATGALSDSCHRDRLRVVATVDGPLEWRAPGASSTPRQFVGSALIPCWGGTSWTEADLLSYLAWRDDDETPRLVAEVMALLDRIDPA